jgi:hypothetical protein
VCILPHLKSLAKSAIDLWFVCQSADEKTTPWALHEGSGRSSPGLSIALVLISLTVGFFVLLHHVAAFYDQPQSKTHMLMHRWSSSHLAEQACQCQLQLTTVADHVRRRPSITALRRRLVLHHRLLARSKL